MTSSSSEETLPAQEGQTNRVAEDAAVLGRGASLSRYVVLEPLGRGGMGVVYAAYDPELDRRVAIKTLHGGDPLLLQREAQALARLSHPNVVAVHDVGVDGGRVFIAMELVEGTTLAQWLEAEPRDWRAVLEVFIGAAQGLAAAHRAQLVHRDFKPANVMMTEDGVPKVTDFGLARDVGGGGEPSTVSGGESSVDLGLTKTGALVGTPLFMSPEQHGGRRATAASDQFSFCVSLYRALYGEHPFESDDLPSLQAAVVLGEVRAPPAGASVPARLGRIVARGLSVDVDDRHESMDALVHALVRIRDRGQRRVMTAVAMAVVGGLAIVAGSRALAPSVCDGVDALPAWDESARRRLTDAFSAVEASYGAVAVERVIPALDAHVTRWGELRLQACRDVSSGAATEPPADLRAACLDRRGDAVTAAIEVMLEADEEVVAGASTIVEQLPQLRACSDPDLATLEPQPASPEDRATVARLRLRLERARARGFAGFVDEAADELTPLLDEAVEVGFAPLVAQVRLERALVLRKTGRHAEAAREAEQAYVDASASGGRQLAARAVAFVMSTHGESLRDDARAEIWAGIARGWLPHVEHRPAIAAEVEGALALHASRRGELEEALAIARRAVARGEGLSLSHKASMIDLAVVLRRAGRIQEAIELLEEVKEGLVEQLGDDHPEVADALWRLGSCYQDVGRDEEALPLLEHAVALREEHPRDALPLGTALMALSNVYFGLNRDEQAYATGTRALDELQRVLPDEHPSLSVALNNLGNYADRLGRRQEAIDHYERSLAIRRAHGGSRELIAPLTNLATTYADGGQLRDRGLPTIEEAWSLAQVHLPDGHPTRAFVQAILGQFLSRDGRHREALRHLEAALVSLEAKLEPRAEIVVDTIRYLGVVQLELGDPRAAMDSMRRVLAVDDLRPDNRAVTLFGLARAQWAAGEHEQARQSALQSIEVLRGIDEEEEIADVERWLEANGGPEPGSHGG